MELKDIDDLVTELLMYLSSTNTDINYLDIVDRLSHCNTDARVDTLIAECIELRQNTISFRIRETQKRIESINKHINQTRFSPLGKQHEYQCLETLYQQSRQQQDRLCLLYKLDYLLLSATKVVK